METPTHTASIHHVMAEALRRYIENHVKGRKGEGRHFFRLDGFDEETYARFLDLVALPGRPLAGQPASVHTTGEIEGYKAYRIAEGRSPTWYRNHLEDGHVLVLVFNSQTTDAQSLDDIYPIKENVLADEGLVHLVQSAFTDYDPGEGEVDVLDGFIQRFRRYVHEPQLRDLVYFLRGVNAYLQAHPESMEDAIAHHLPHLGLFRCRKLAVVMSSAKKLRRLLRHNEKASRLGREQLDDRKQQKLLKSLESHDFEDIPGLSTLSAEEKKKRLRDFLLKVNVNHDDLVRIFEIDWSEVEPVLHRRTRRNKAERLRAIAEELEDAFEEHGLQDSDLSESVQETVKELSEGKQPDDRSLDELVFEYGDNVPSRLKGRIKRLRRPEVVKTVDFTEGVMRAVIKLLGSADEDIADPTLRVVPVDIEKLRESDLKAEDRETLMAFKLFYHGIARRMPSIEWDLGDLWSLWDDHDFDALIDDEDADEKVKGELVFRMELLDDQDRIAGYCDLKWLYTSEGTTGATLANVLHEHRLVETTEEGSRLRIPLYYTSSEDEAGASMDLDYPIESLGAWYRLGGVVDLATVLRERLHKSAPQAEVDAVMAAVDQLSVSWAAFMRKAPDGLHEANLDAVLRDYDDLLTLARGTLSDIAVQICYPVINAAWIIGPDPFDAWAVMPPIHPLKLRWRRERVERFEAMTQRLLDQSEDALIVDDERLLKELDTAYSSSHIPAVLALPGRNDRCGYLVPVTESGGYELFRRLARKRTTTSLHTDLASGDERDRDAKVMARELTRIVKDYCDTYPFVTSGLEVYLVDCRDGALPVRLAESIGKALGAENGRARVNLIVHTTDSGIALYEAISDWVRADETYSGRQPHRYFPNVTLKVVECSYDDLRKQVDDRDLVILADVLATKGQEVDAELREDKEGGAASRTLTPLYNLSHQPIQAFKKSRSMVLTPRPMPALLQHFYDAQYAGGKEEPIELAEASYFEKKVSLRDWETELKALHETFNWVVCYDTSVDRRLLQNTFPEAVQVIRYSTGLGRRRQHSLTVSSSGRVERIVKSRLGANLRRMFELTDDAFRLQLADRIIREAKDISGDIVLRATGPGTYLNEIIGLVGAKAATEGRSSHPDGEAIEAWIYLDNYAHWFKRKLPDLLRVVVYQREDSGLVVQADVIEAKCVSEGSFAREDREAQQQVAQGVNRLGRAWAPGKRHLDASYWYHQLYQAFAGNLQIGQADQPLWEAFDAAMTSGDFELRMSGHSFVFCHDGPAGLLDDIVSTEAKVTPPDLDDVPCHVHQYGKSGLLRVMRHLVEQELLSQPADHTGDGALQSSAPSAEPAATGNPKDGEDPQENDSSPGTRADADRSPASPSTTAKEPPAWSENAVAGRIGEPEGPIAQKTSGEATGAVEEEQEGAEAESERDDELASWLSGKARQLQMTLKNYGVGAYPIDPEKTDVGPSIARFKVQLRPGEQLSKVQRISKDMQRELAVEKEPIVDNVPGESFVGVDLPRPEPSTVRLLDELHRVGGYDGRLPFLVGVSPSGEAHMKDLAKLPHLLVAGSTGSGKTVFLYSLIVSLLHRHSPGALKLLLVDPKQTDFIFFEGLPHVLPGEVIVEPDEAIEWLRHLMEKELVERTQLLRESRSRNIAAHNEKRPDQPLPYIVVVIDEYADLVHVLEGGDKDEFERQLVRLAQRARSVGIHLVIATQRPSADIVTSRLKTNLSGRIAFRLPSHHDSSIVLDQTGAENLIGRGDMLALLEGDLARLQGYFIAEDELDAFVRRRS